MTRKELVEILEQYSPNMEVVVSCDQYSRAVLKVDEVVELGTNVVSIDIQVEDKPDISEIVRRAKESMYAREYHP